MKYILEKDNKYLSNIVTSYAKTKSIFSDNQNIAIIFHDKKDATSTAKRFNCKVKPLS